MKFKEYKYKNNGNVQNFIIYTVNNCNKCCITINNNNNKEKRKVPEHTYWRKQEHAQKRYKMRPITRQGCTKNQSHGSKRDKQEIKYHL